MVLVQRVATKTYGRGAATISEGVGVISVSPSLGSTAGGTAITITGDNFTGTPTVTVGGVACTSVVVVSASTITCVTGAGSAGVVDVVVDGSGAGNQLFTYNAAAVWYEQNWDYADTTAMKADAYAVNEDNGTVTLQTATVEGGLSSVNKAMRATYATSGTSTAGLDLLPPNYSTDKPREVWIEIYMRFDASWNPTSDDKTFFWLEDRSGVETARWELHMESATRWYGGPSDALGSGIPDFFINSSTGVDPHDGNFGRFRLHFKMSSTPTATDGKFRVWWNDTVIFNQASFATNSPSGTGAFFRNIALGRNADPTGSGVRDWGRVRIHITDPGW